MRDFRGGYVRRVIDDHLDQLMAQLPALLLDGPKAVGKTRTARERAATVWRLHRPAEAQIVRADPARALASAPPILLDEYQRVEGLWDEVKDTVDDDAAPGRLLLTGSAPPRGSHTGAGRIASVRMRPLTLPERGAAEPTVSLEALFGGGAHLSGQCPLELEDYVDLLLASGFPGMQHLTGVALTTQLDSYVERLVDREMEEAGYAIRRPASLKAWLSAYAAAVSTTTSWEKIRDAATSGQGDKPAKATTLPYIDVLTRLRVLDELPAWTTSRNHLARLTEAPKHHLADAALAARLVGASKGSLLRGRVGAFTPEDGTYLGQLFESLATMSVRAFAAILPANVSHLRQSGGRHEIDLLVERLGDRSIVAFEVKLTGDVVDEDVKHLTWLRESLGDQLVDCVVLTAGRHAYRRRDGVGVVPLGLLGA